MTRNMKRTAALALAAALLSGMLSGCGDKPGETEIFAMDTVMRFTAYGKSGQKAADAAAAEVRRLAKLLDRTEADSEVSHVNDGAGTAVEVSGETGRLIRCARTISEDTGGAFDITVAPVMDAWGFTGEDKGVPATETLDSLLPLVDSGRIAVEEQEDAALVFIGEGQSIDLGGIAKGYASEKVESVFREYGVKSALAWLGGNVYAHGEKPDGSAWRVAVQDPENTDSYVGVLGLRDAYAITSGGYQRYFEQNGQVYHHIIDPATGYPADSGLLSVTVVAPAVGPEGGDGLSGGTMADAFSTALFVMGEERAVDFWRQSGYDFDMVLVTEDGRLLVTASIADEFERNEDAGYAYEIIR